MLTSHLVCASPRRARSRPGPLALVGLVLTTLVLGLLPPLAPPAHADDTAPNPVRVEITDFSPEIIDPKNAEQRVSLTGTVTNTSREPVAAAQVLLWRSPTPIVSASRLRTTLASDESTPLGTRLTSGSGFQTVTAGRGPLAPGETVPFTVSASPAELGVAGRSMSTVALLGVHVLGNLGDRGRDLLGRSRIVAPVLGSTPPRTTSLSSVVVLSSRPSALGGRQFADDHLAAEIADNGRLTRLIESAERSNVSWALDPLLVRSLTVMSGGYSVIGRDGRAHAGAGRESAGAFLDRLDRLDPRRGFRTQLGALDVVSVGAQDDATRRQWVDAALRALDPGQSATADDPSADLPLLVWTTDGVLDPAALRLASSWKARAVLAGNLTSEETIAGGPDGLTLVGYDPAELTGGPLPEPRSSAPQRTERALAQSLLAADSEPAHIRVITDAAAAAADRDAPWLRRVPLDRSLSGSAPPWSGELSTSGVHTHDLGADQLRSTQRLADDVRDHDEITGDDSGDLARSVLGGALSSWWRTSPDARTPWLEAADTRLGSLVDGRGLRIATQNRVTLTSARGQFPVTVSNLTDSPANLSVDLVSDNAKRLEATGIGVRTIAPGQSLTFNAAVTARGNGPVPLRVQLRAPDGRSVGRPTMVLVTATNLGAVGWIIVAVSGVVLVGATVLRIRQVRAHGRSTSPSPTPRRP